MPSVFPGAIDNFTDPLIGSPLNSPSHAGQHQDINDAVEKVETYMGLVKVIPTSVSAGNTLAANGTVTIGSAQTSVTVNGAFSSLYDKYLVLLTNISCSVDNTDLRLRLGLTASTTVYYTLVYQTIGSSVVSGSSGGTQPGLHVSFTENAPVGFVSKIELDNPFLPVLTRYQADWGNNDYNGVYRGFDNTNTSYTNFMIIPASGTMTGGTIRVYGYRN